LPEAEIAPLQFPLPVAVRIHLIDKDSPVLAAVTSQITLSIAIDIEPPHQAPSVDRLLPDRRIDCLSAPWHLAGKTHVN
jgi:hypothetical protein